MKNFITFNFLSILLFAQTVQADKKTPIDPKIEKKAIESLYNITVLVANADKIYSLSNLPQAKADIDAVIKALNSFKQYNYIITALNHLKLAQNNIDNAYTITGGTQEDILKRNYHIHKVLDAIFKAEQTLKFGEIPQYKSSKEELQDFYNRVTSAKRSLNEAIAKLKLKKPEIKEAIKIVQQAKATLRPFLQYQVINNRVDIFLTLNALKYLNQALEEKDRLERERNIQNAILAIVYATEFLDDAEKDLKKII